MSKIVEKHVWNSAFEVSNYDKVFANLSIILGCKCPPVPAQKPQLLQQACYGFWPMRKYRRENLDIEGKRQEQTLHDSYTNYTLWLDCGRSVTPITVYQIERVQCVVWHPFVSRVQLQGGPKK